MEYLYEEIVDYVKELETIIDILPNFENKFECEDYLKWALTVCIDWLKEHEDEYMKEQEKEIHFQNLEFEKERKC